MNQRIYKDKDELVCEVRVPLMTHRSNPYDENENSPMDNIVGTIYNDEIGFANWIDMSYAGKEDQISTSFYIYHGEKEDFKKLCKELNIDCNEYPECAYCFKSILGSFTLGIKGNLCYECELRHLDTK